MKTTLSIIKADIGSIGGHILPSEKLVTEVRDFVVGKSKGLINDFFISFTGIDTAILFSHSLGEGSEKVHKLAWDAFVAGTKVAKEQGLYEAGQDLLKDSFSGNVKGMGPALTEMDFEERPNEPFLFFAADKTDPGAYNLPLYLAFLDPPYNAELILSPTMNKAFKFFIMGANYMEGDQFIGLNAPEEMYDIAALLRDNQRFVIEGIYSPNNEEILTSISAIRLRRQIKRFVIYIDILGFARPLEQLTKILYLTPVEIKQKWIGKINRVLASAQRKKFITDFYYRDSDNWLVLTKGADDVYNLFGDLSNVGLPLEIAIDFMNLPQNHCFLDDRIMAFLNHDILADYREWFKQRNGEPIKETFALSTEQAYFALGRDKYWEKPHRGAKYYLFKGLSYQA